VENLNFVNWRDFDALLGTCPDSEIARKAGCSKEAVRQRRKSLGIPVFRMSYVLTDECKADFGKMEDAEVAAKHGLPPTVVTRARRKLNIGLPTRDAPVRKALQAIDWQNDTRTDAEIAEAIGSITSTVCRIRNELNVPKASARGREWPTQNIPTRYAVKDKDLTPYLCLFPVMKIQPLAVLTRIDPSTVAKLKKQWGIRNRQQAVGAPRDWVPIAVRLGTVPDGVLAEETGVPLGQVTNMRRRLSVPAFQPDRTPLVTQILASEAADEEAAEQFGVSLSYVCLIRKHGAA
jgi:hypothetical protein